MPTAANPQRPLADLLAALEAAGSDRQSIARLAGLSVL